MSKSRWIIDRDGTIFEIVGGLDKNGRRFHDDITDTVFDDEGNPFEVFFSFEEAFTVRNTSTHWKDSE